MTARARYFAPLRPHGPRQQAPPSPARARERERSSLRTLRTVTGQRRLPPRARSAGPTTARLRNATPKRDGPARAHVWGKQAERSEAVGGSPHQGTPETITDNAGNVVKQDYAPFGARNGSPPTIAGITTRVGFTSQHQDDDLGLTDMGGRIFDPLAGRFTTPDPILQAPFFSQGQNRYAYVLNDPINLTDPSGFVVASVWNEGFTIGNTSYTTALTGDIGSELASGSTGTGVAEAASSMPTSLGSALPAAVAIAPAVINLVQDVGGLFANDPPSGAHSQTVAAPGRTPSTKNGGQPRAMRQNKKQAPVPTPAPKAKPADEWPDDGAWRQAQQGPGFDPVKRPLVGDKAFKGDPKLAEAYDTAAEGLFYVATAVPFGAEEIIGEAAAALLKEGGVFLRGSRAGYRLHGLLPHAGQVRQFSSEALVELREATQTSIATREGEMLRLGAKGAHANRLGGERRLLQTINEILRGRGIP